MDNTSITNFILVISGTIVTILLTIVGWFLRKVYSEMSEWRKEITAWRGDISNVLHQIDKRVYRLEILSPTIQNSLVDPPLHQKD